jgi:hypothetical protein
MAKTHDGVEMRAADSDGSIDGFSGTSEDAKDMYRLGRSQELKVWPASNFIDCAQECSRLVNREISTPSQSLV